LLPLALPLSRVREGVMPQLGKDLLHFGTDE
jgi:hypothetical protein